MILTHILKVCEYEYNFRDPFFTGRSRADWVTMAILELHCTQMRAIQIATQRFNKIQRVLKEVAEQTDQNTMMLRKILKGFAGGMSEVIK